MNAYETMLVYVFVYHVLPDCGCSIKNTSLYVYMHNEQSLGMFLKYIKCEKSQNCLVAKLKKINMYSVRSVYATNQKEIPF